MAIRRLPIRPGVPAFIFRTDLDDTTYQFSFTFNGRAQLWTMDVADENGNELLFGIPVHVRQNLLKQYQYNQSLPQGRLAAINLVDANVNPTFENFGEDVLLLYEEV